MPETHSFQPIVTVTRHPDGSFAITDVDWSDSYLGGDHFDGDVIVEISGADEAGEAACEWLDVRRRTLAQALVAAQFLGTDSRLSEPEFPDHTDTPDDYEELETP